MLALKITGSNRRSNGGFQWPDSGPVECPDWDPKPECGNGFHGWANGEGDYRHSYNTGVFLVLEVVDSEVVDLTGKVKFPRCVVVHCGTRESAVEYLIEAGALTETSDPAWACLSIDDLVTVAMRAADRAVRKHAPKALRARGLESEATELESLLEIKGTISALKAKSATSAAAATDIAAAYAANAAASADDASYYSAAYADDDAIAATATATAATAAYSAASADAAGSKAYENEQCRLDKLEMLGLITPEERAS